jgi:hypothetical protein
MKLPRKNIGGRTRSGNKTIINKIKRPGHYRPLKTGLLFPSKGKGASSLMGVPHKPRNFRIFFTIRDELVASERCRHNIGHEMRIRAIANPARLNELIFYSRRLKAYKNRPFSSLRSKDK